MTTTPAIRARGLCKSYGDHLVLDGIDLDVPAGSIFALLGPNGSGKTTTVQILSTLIRPDAGEVEVGGFDLIHNADDVRSLIGVTGQFSAVDAFLTGEENLRLIADLNHLRPNEGRQRLRDLLQRFDIVDAAKQTPAKYSGGMRRRLDLAMTLVGSPRIIFLDEPTAGLDPRSRRGMWDIVRDLVSDGVTIFLTTQYLEEADQLADRIAVLDHGKIIAQGTSSELKRLVPGGHVRLEFADTAALDAAGLAFGNAKADVDALTLQVPSDGSPQSLRDVLDTLDRRSIQPSNLAIHAPDLDDVFLALTGQRGGVHQAEKQEARS
ncbi:MAG: ATP-binding cassette domain-containing protein [Candidatus Dormibacteraeota bacterium]|nr:ATP-binding cassette domain-containing protein [Candidatus Dormibacteraeota bacterium]